MNLIVTIGIHERLKSHNGDIWGTKITQLKSGGQESHNHDMWGPKLHNWNLVDQNRTIMIPDRPKMQLSLSSFKVNYSSKYGLTRPSPIHLKRVMIHKIVCLDSCSKSVDTLFKAMFVKRNKLLFLF